MITAEKNETTTTLPRTATAQPVPRTRPLVEEAAALPPVRRRPMARKGLRSVRRAQDFGWRSPEAAAVVVASFCVSLACFYVAAYARITAEGFEAAQVREQIKQAAADKESLEAGIAHLTLPATVKARAVQMGMVQTTPQTVRLVTPPASPVSPDQTTP